MAATARNGREYLLQELLPKIQDDNLWEIITRDLFEQRDRNHLWRLKYAIDLQNLRKISWIRTVAIGP